MVAEAGSGSIDRYVVLEYLAEGGMGAIYLGKKLGAGGFEKHVVLKQLLPEFTRQPEFIDLFLREARLSATLDHANIIHTIDLVTAGEEHFIVMEYLDGADLRTLLKKAKRNKNRFSAAAGIFIAREMLSALAYAHNKVGDDGRPLALIHRDISPSNILISGNGEVKLTDFGIAKASTHNSVFYRVKGKVGYMSPEQARSEDLDARSDLYSLAVCLYEIITGERLFINVGLTVSAEEMYSQPVPMISRKVSGLPPELDKVMLKALSIDPGHRYQTAGQLQEALIRCAHRHNLMLSAPELAEQLRGWCGPSDMWREDARPGSSPQAGTEIYDLNESTEQLNADDLDLDSDPSDVIQLSEAGSLLDQGRRRRERALTSLTHLTELKGLELTSIIHMASDDHHGAEPLLDIDAESEKLLSESGITGSAPPAPASAPALPAPRPAPLGSFAALSPHDARAPLPQPQPPPPSFPPRALSEDFSLPRGETISGPDPQVAPAPTPAQKAPTSRGVPLFVLIILLVVGAGAALGIGLTGPSIDLDEAATLPE